MEILILLLVVAGMFGCGALARSIAAQKGAGHQGFWLGFWLGPVGCIIAGFLDGRRCCRRCGTRIEAFARVCPSCRSHLPAPAQPRKLKSTAAKKREQQSATERWLESPGPIDLSLKHPGEM